MNTVKLIFVIILTLVITSCSSIVTLSNPKVLSAIDLQESVINDPLFSQVLIDINKNVIFYLSNKCVLEDFDTNKKKTEWLLDQFKIKKGYSKESVFIWRKFNPFSSTIASTDACSDYTKINIWNLSSNKYSILNTLIHERSHSFGIIHIDQNKSKNRTHISYISGQLAELIINFRTHNSLPDINNSILPKFLINSFLTHAKMI